MNCRNGQKCPRSGDFIYPTPTADWSTLIADGHHTSEKIMKKKNNDKKLLKNKNECIIGAPNREAALHEHKFRRQSNTN